MKHWIDLVSRLPLSDVQREVVNRFSADIQGRLFLPIADILKAHNKLDESLELLLQGVANHPRYSVARVVLVRELFHKGMVNHAWDCVQSSPVSLNDNLLAQHLIFKLSIVLEDETSARAALQNIRNHNLSDPEVMELGRLLVSEGIFAVKDVICREAIKRGHPLNVNRVPQTESAAASPLSKPVLTKVYRGVENFHVLALSDIFTPDGANSSEDQSLDSGVELDSTTLAEIFESQHHYGKALGIYRRLLRMSPRNDLLRRKVSELARKSSDQKNADLALDPSLVDQMEEASSLDKRIDYLQGFLENLESK